MLFFQSLLGGYADGVDSLCCLWEGDVYGWGWTCHTRAKVFGEMTHMRSRNEEHVFGLVLRLSER